MRWRVAIALVCGWGAGFGVAQESAPLSSTKQQLQSLQKDQAAKQADLTPRAAEGLLRVDVSIPQMPSSSEPVRQKQDDATARKTAGEKNWLLDGVKRLERAHIERGLRPGEREDSEEEKALDPESPDYFLRLYERQRAERDQLREKDSSLSGPESSEANVANEVLAPFMQNWLAGSPVREVLQDQFSTAGRASQPDGVGNGANRQIEGTSATVRSATGGFVGPELRPGSKGEGSTNPYLQALTNNPPFPAQAGVNFEPRINIPVVAGPRATPESPLAESPKSAPVAKPASVQDENKRYFPQLRKF